MRHEITGDSLHDGDSLHGPSRVVIEDGLIVSIEPLEGPARHRMILPGLVDLQMNGYRHVDVAECSHDDFVALDAMLLAEGTTSWLATVVTAPLDRLSTTIARLHEWVSRGDTGCRGIHVEGPFLGLAPGAHNPRWIIDIDKQWLSALPSGVRLVTLAPEQDSAAAAVAQLVGQGVVVSLGHTRAADAEFDAAVSAGAAMVTHLFNGMSGVHHREAGVALSALVDPRVTVGMIADGVHVSPRAMGLAFAAKTPRGVCLVSDSIAWDSGWARSMKVQVKGGAPRLPDGTLAGSSSSLMQCVAMVARHGAASVEGAVTSATSTPADLIGFPQAGRIRVGSPAEMVCIDDDFHVTEVHRRLVSLRGSQTD